MKCFICKKTITRKLCPSEIKRNKHFFCSRKCYNVYWIKERTGEKNINWKGGNIERKCNLCGKIYSYQRGSTKDSKFCSKKCQCKFNLSGKKHWKWKGGISSDRDKIKHTWKYTKWRQRVYKRDNWTCVMCKKHCQKGNIHAHHIYKFSDYPELRFKMNNGITLCIKCHNKTYGKEEKFAKAFKEILNDYTTNKAKA